MKKIILILLFIPLVSFGQDYLNTKDAIDKTLSEIKPMLPIDLGDGIIWKDAINENNTNRVYVYEIDKEALDYVLDDINKISMMQSLVSMNQYEFTRNNRINVVYRYYYKGVLFKEITIKHGDWDAFVSLADGNNKEIDEPLNASFELGDYISFKDNPKAKGVNIKVRKPVGWELRSGTGPNTLFNFINGEINFTIVITELPTFLSKNEAKETLKNEEDVNLLKSTLLKGYNIVTNNESAVIISSNPTTITTYPALEATTKVRFESAGIVENVIYLSWSIFYEDRVISVAGSLKESDYNNETEKQIRAIVTSIYFEDLFK
tara:strand:+ start:804 stop:1763 length:960 start_codon:yes stop_codon:yes gene_type:complete